jgi:hypothetical protein
MKHLCATAATLLMAGSVALAQTTPPGATVTPGITTPSPSDGATTGRGPNVNPSNPQDKIGRSNPQDMTTPRAKNPQDGGGSVPRIMVPER